MSISEDVCRTVRREIRAAGLVNQPDPCGAPPSDLDAEGEILSALLDAHATQADLAPLEGHHFFADFHRAIWAAATECPPGDLEGIFRCLTTRGWQGAISVELAGIVLNQPWICLTRLRAHVPRLIELAARRELLDRVHVVEVELRGGTITAAQARAVLKK